MKYLSILLLLFVIEAGAQQQTYDLLTFTSSKGWKKSKVGNTLVFDTAHKTNRTWCRIAVLKSTESKGSLHADFDSDWQELAVKPHGVSATPMSIDTQTIDGWNVQSGLGKFVFNKDTATLALTTFSDGLRYTSVMMMTNGKGYGVAIERFLSSIKLPKANTANNPKAQTVVPTKVSAGDFAFSTTNFDDGWTSVAKEDWVEATKGSIKVLLHYPRKEDEVYYTQHQERMSVFWNMLVAPRYSNLRNYESPGSNLAESAYFACGLVTDNLSGKDVWVTLFSKGKSGWIEIITPDKAGFVKAFGIENPHVYFTEWEPLAYLSGLNRFAIAANDLAGKWSTQFSGSTAYYGIYTGVYAGSSTYASSQSFVFAKAKTYHWNLAVAKSGVNTSMQVDKVSANGNWKMLNNWQIWFSDIERRPKTYNAYFSCIKGGRILWLQDVEYGSYTAYGRISK